MHALLDQFKKFSGVVKQMGGVKELFKDEKQVKNLNPQKMGKVCKSIIQTFPKFVHFQSKVFTQPNFNRFRCTRVWLKLWTLKC